MRALAHCPQCPHAQGDRQICLGTNKSQEQVWLQVEFTHFWLLLSTLELACCSHILMWVCVLCCMVCRKLIADFSGDALVCSHVLRGSCIALSSLKREFQNILKCFQGTSLVCLSLSAQLHSMPMFLVALGTSWMTLCSAWQKWELSRDTSNNVIAVK